MAEKLREPITGDQVNALLRATKAIIGDNDGQRELSLLAIALCAAARDCHIAPETFIASVAGHYEEICKSEMVPLYSGH